MEKRCCIRLVWQSRFYVVFGCENVEIFVSNIFVVKYDTTLLLFILEYVYVVDFYVFVEAKTMKYF